MQVNNPLKLAPKFDIKTSITHEAVVKTPVHMGTEYASHTQNSMNRVTGQTSSKTVLTEKPIIGVVNNVRQVTSDVQHFVNIHTGKIINPYKKPEYHGQNPL